MSSVHSYIRQTTTLFTNGKDMISTIFLSDGATRPIWVTSTVNAAAFHSSIRVPGNAVFRDMGKLVYRPTPDVGAGDVSTILRKVQLVPQGALQTGEGVGAGVDGAYFVGYVSVGAVDGTTGGLVRIN
jgi:hypothetical protein